MNAKEAIEQAAQEALERQRKLMQEIVDMVPAGEREAASKLMHKFWDILIPDANTADA